MMKILASGWEKTFSRRSPMVMASFARNTAAALRKFHCDVEARARKIGSVIAGLSLLNDQVANYETTLKDLSTAMKDSVSNSQKEISREFTPVIQKAMESAYVECVNEHGEKSSCEVLSMASTDQHRHRSRLLCPHESSYDSPS